MSELRLQGTTLNKGRRFNNAVSKLRTHTTLSCEIDLQTLILLTKKVHLKIKSKATETKNHNETGGLLLGYKFLNCFFVTEITATNDTESTSVSFVLNGENHIGQAKMLVNKRILKPFVIGVWHSHICDIKNFSIQDKKTNSKLASQIGDIVSVIVTYNQKDMYCYTGCYIKRDAREYYCLVKIMGD